MTAPFRAQFLRHLRERGPTGVRLVISDSHSSLVTAIRKVMLGAAWQRPPSRVHANLRFVGVRTAHTADYSEWPNWLRGQTSWAQGGLCTGPSVRTRRSSAGHGGELPAARS